LQYLHLPT
jgi:hypothetical protein